MEEVLFVVDPGHGGADPGAVAAGFSLREKDLTLAISKRIQYTLAKDYICRVRLTRDNDRTLNLSDRARLANEWGAKYFVSTHVNAGGGTGYEDFIHINIADSAATARYRGIVHSEIQGVLDKYKVRNRGMKKANFSVLRNTRMSAVLTETLFIDNAQDQALLSNNDFIKDIADAHARGIAKAFNIPKRQTPAQIEEPDHTPAGNVGLHRIIVDGNQIGAWGTQSYLLRNIEKALESGAKEIQIQKV